MKRTLKDYVRVSKLWGSEIWICNNPLYCGKILILEPGFRTSIHRHLRKHETMLCVQGQVGVRLYGGSADRTCLAWGEEEAHVLLPMESIEIPPGLWHSLEAGRPKTAVLYEFSTHHDDEDVERDEPSKAL